MISVLKVFLITLFLFSSKPLVAQPPEILRLVANEWEPYTGDRILNQGLATDIVSTALRRAGYDVMVNIVPWTRALKGVEAGNYHGIIAAWYNKEREKKMVYSDHYLTNDLVLFKRSEDQITFESLSDLEPYTIGTVRDYAYGEGFDTSQKLKKKPSLDLRTNIVRVSNGLIDLFPEDRFVVKHLLNTRYPEYFGKIDFLDKPLSQRTLHMTISKKTMDYEKIVQDFNQQLAAMKAEGLLDKLIKKHNLNF
ncbi:Extracellular solute-binding protein [Candidatus Terasakiella magnetica]|uniref:Extracellular solute-binding protein n=1 Tax=Candidatus Terasakiella magnetica TaxID=1867952 RepID=A0A1C3RJH7_9PROT|nr:transporter substrate-binding domain-containing protein [Candidatus Terasakiella magnetica]SCA57444.1 Extracellular solute-binding protein [Candidatus Terasakiella magnetica]